MTAFDKRAIPYMVKDLYQKAAEQISKEQLVECLSVLKAECKGESEEMILKKLAASIALNESLARIIIGCFKSHCDEKFPVERN